MENKIHNQLKSVLESENMSDGVVIIKNTNVEITDGLMSEIYRVKVTKEDLTNNKHELNLIIKLSPTDPQYQKTVKILYASEIHFYDAVVPAFDRLQMKYLGKPFNFVPKYYGVVKDGNQENIILEDLSVKGYKMLNTKYVFTGHYLKTVLQALGKFHALSIALQTKDPDIWDQLFSGIDQADVYSEEIIDWFRDTLKKTSELYSAETSVHNKLTLICDNFPREIKTLLKPSKKYPSVIVHMDPWCNNFLFKHSQTKEIQDVVLIDFQTSCKGSPVLDVSCFLYINASLDALYYWQDMLKVYHDSLCEHGRALNCRVEEMYSWEMFMNDWKHYAKYGVIKAAMGSFIPHEEDPVMTQDVNTVEVNFFAEKLDVKTNKRLRLLLCHAADENFF